MNQFNETSGEYDASPRKNFFVVVNAPRPQDGVGWALEQVFPTKDAGIPDDMLALLRQLDS
jgi:hypothetical protein